MRYPRGERLQHGVHNQECEERRCDGGFGEEVDNERRNEGEAKSRPECPDPGTERCLSARPAGSEPAAEYLEREVNEDSDREVFPPKTFLDHFEGCHGLVGLEPHFRKEMHDDHALYIYE